jgi:hypothetical protein
MANDGKIRAGYRQREQLFGPDHFGDAIADRGASLRFENGEEKA